MSKSYRDGLPINPEKFVDQLMRLKRGSIGRREFLGLTGLGVATAVMARELGIMPSPAFAQEGLGDRMSIATWPNYHDPATFENFKAETGVAVEVNVFGSNEEMLAKLQAGASGWSLFVPTNYTISTYKKLNIIEALDMAKLSNFDGSQQDARFTGEGTIDGATYAVPKNWGTTGFAVNTKKLTKPITSWKEFWDTAMADGDGRTMVHDYQLTTIGNALKYFGFSFNSLKPDELAKAEELLLKVKPHLFAVSSDYQPSMRAGDAWMTMCWTNDGAQLHRDIPEIAYVLGKEGGEIWTDFYAIPKDAPNKPAGYALLNYLMDPKVAVKEHLANGAPSTDARVNALLPKEVLDNPILYPAAELLSPLEFGAAATLTDPARAELMARFKSA
ncbi:MAG: spermidine/putrescine ABC transporter substrate-binding protein [Mesorhizobium sp.]|uniref:ABC transporter substrate-binding protein n=1 Tax=Mesorhizobium sp. TaxID=1871066 RepID=UPI000FEA04BD|nr:spermidine/putrescine ABC transporter substrate-binding protein [Mesorhizobium sp.]RWQ36055.1 MAG: spermidine/putrescine ABC transporter substrate-binding protein [Mesorhizobium sp.]TIL24273.1 MAG: spermidine/putrescine ABC transporter substrate-binding protein [Mesorhizobium sp.]